MKTKNCNFVTKRRGLSSIVGALIFVVLMVATFAVLGVALDSQTDIVDVSRDVADLGLKKQQESFQINSIRQDSGQSLKVETTNKGQNPTEIFTMVITNSSDVANGYPTDTFAIPYDNSLLPPGHSDPINVAETLDLKMKLPSPLETDTYDIKLVSSLGTIQKYKIECRDVAGNSICGPGVDPTGPGGLSAQLFLDGPNGINTKTTTVIMFVTNTGDVTLSNVAPVFGNPTPDCDDMWSVAPTGGLEDISPCDLDSVSPTTLIPGQTYLFKWDGTVAGEIDDVFTFCNQVSGEEPDATIVTSSISCDSMTVIDPNDCGGCEGGEGEGNLFILVDDLLIRPSMYMIMPSPFGTIANNEDYQGLWGVNLVNPTEKPMSVSKVTIVAYPPASNDNVNLLVSGCPMTMIAPDADWTCPRANTIMWQNVLAPIPLPEYSSTPFLVKVEPGQVASTDDVDALIVQANAFTTIGSFGKSSYQSSMKNAPETIANVYLTSTLKSRTDIQSQRDTITELELATFNMTLADMDDNNETYIKEGARLIINVPRDWGEVCITSSNGFDGTTGCEGSDSRITRFNDNSTQIIVTTSVDIGGNAANENLDDAQTVVFTSSPPENEIPNQGRPYIMYVLADGLSGTNFPISPLSEVALVVQPAP